MSGDTRFHVHHDAPVQVGRRERLGVRLLIVADGAFVFSMIFSYFYLRNLNANNGWIPEGGHTLRAMSGWVTVFPLIIAAITHRIAMKSGNGFKNIAPITFVVLLVGMYLQWKQLAHMPFQVDGEAEGEKIFGFEGAYSSSWVLIAGANMFHYILGAFVALGVALRSRRNDLNAVLEFWRHRTVSSWLTWIAISGIACAITTSVL
jgi:heme/copper-type cytochrome/quinol oxidase subunit 3